MDVNRATFSASLTSILKHISKAQFVAFDLELSGIPDQRRRGSDGRQTLADRYKELKEAAGTYHILQVGLTCVEEDVKSQKYVMRAYNFDLSPLIYEGIDYERSFTYSSGAVDFLLQHNYQMNAPFAHGIPYLSRDEADESRERTRMRWDKGAVPDIVLRTDDTQAANFMKRVRTEIDDWKQLPKSSAASILSISGEVPPDSLEPDVVVALNRFEKRLVHQIVRADYPDLQTFGRLSCVQIEKKSRNHIDEEQSEKGSLQRRLSQAISNQSGFRWVAEALAGEHGDLSGIDLSTFSRHTVGEQPAPTYNAFLKRFEELRHSLKQRQTVLVGHNCFLDLIYIYKNFYGPLPDTVEEFQEAIQKLFPLVIDTKYMATSGPNGFAFRSFQLWQIQEALAHQDKPKIEPANDHPNYEESENYHQAGFDSLVTAKVFLKLAAMMDVEESASTKTSKDQEPHDQDVAISNHTHGIIESTIQTTPKKENANPTLTSQPPPSQPAQKSKKSRSKKKSNKTSSSASEISNGKFFTTNNMYSHLPSDNEPVDDDDDVVDVVEKPTSSSNATKPPQTNTTTNVNGLDALQLNGNGGQHDKREDRSTLIPAFSNAFWTTYGNKMRVYGTVEEVCDLTRRAPTAVKKEAGTGAVDGVRETVVDIPAAVEEAPPGRKGSNSMWEILRSFV